MLCGIIDLRTQFKFQKFGPATGTVDLLFLDADSIGRGIHFTCPSEVTEKLCKLDVL
jgi:hypothetical protein